MGLRNFLGFQAELGTAEACKRADLVFPDGGPLAGIVDARRICGSHCGRFEPQYDCVFIKTGGKEPLK